MTIQANCLQNALFWFHIVRYQKSDRGPSNTFSNPRITEYSPLSTRFQMPGSFTTTINMSNIAEMLCSTNYYC